MLEKIGYTFLVVALIAWIFLFIRGLVDALPEGLIGFAVIIGLGILFIKVIKDRINNKEDDYYNKNVDK